MTIKELEKNIISYIWRPVPSLIKAWIILASLYGGMIAIDTQIKWLAYDSFTSAYAETKPEPAEGSVSKLNVLLGTPMENAIPYIEKASKYFSVYEELYLCVANAESSFSKFPKDCFNPFGIKPDGQLKCYESWEQSINGFSALIKYYYLNEGKITAEQIMPKYVGYDSPDWVKNCKKFYDPEVVVIVE